MEAKCMYQQPIKMYTVLQTGIDMQSQQSFGHLFFNSGS